jgi:hypothetical protein
MTIATFKRRNWLRGILALAAVTAVFIAPATAAATTPSVSKIEFTAWAGNTSATQSIAFTAHEVRVFGHLLSSDKVSGFEVAGDSSVFNVTKTNCDNGQGTADCSVSVNFTAPAEATLPYYHATLKLMSDWDGPQYDGVVDLYGFAGVKGVDGATGPQGPGCVVRVAPVEESPNEGDNVAFPECPKGADGAPGPKGDTGAAGPVGATGATGATGAVGAAGPSAPASAALVVTKVKYVSVRSSCMVKRNVRKKTRTAYCLVKVPKGTPKSKWTLMAGGTRIGTGTMKSGVRTFRVTKKLPKTVGGWITVKLTKVR